MLLHVLHMFACSQTDKGVFVREPGADNVDASTFPELAPLFPLFGSRVKVTLSDGRRLVGTLQVRRLAWGGLER